MFYSILFGNSNIFLYLCELFVIICGLFVISIRTHALTENELCKFLHGLWWRTTSGCHNVTR